MDAPAVAVSSDGKKFAAAWMDMRAGNRDVQWTVTGSGKAAPESAAHDSGAGIQGHPSVAFDAEGIAWCAWEDGRGGPNAVQIYVADSKSKKNVALSAAAEGKCGYPTIASGGGLLGVAYESGSGVYFRVVGR